MCSILIRGQTKLAQTLEEERKKKNSTSQNIEYIFFFQISILSEGQTVHPNREYLIFFKLRMTIGALRESCDESNSVSSAVCMCL